MKPPAIVAPEISEAEIVHRWDMATEREQRTEKTLAETRLEKGRILVQARAAYPRTGNDGRWSKLLGRLRVEARTALNYMRLAGYVDGSASETLSEVTYADAGIVKRPTKVEPEEPREVQSTRARADAAYPLSVLDESSDLTFAPSVPLAFNVVSETWAEDMESLAQQMIRSARQMFSAAEQLDALCRQRQAAISSAKFASIPTHLLAAQASIASTLRIFKGEAS